MAIAYTTYTRYSILAELALYEFYFETTHIVELHYQSQLIYLDMISTVPLQPYMSNVMSKFLNRHALTLNAILENCVSPIRAKTYSFQI